MEKKVSVIVPVHNGENYIENCMNCLMGQTMDDIEVIVIDDGSTDNSVTILKDWKNRFPEKINLIVLEQNEGPGGARNKGLKAVAGEYVGFMDCDDVIDRTMYEKLYAKAKTENADIVDCGYYDEAKQQAILSFTNDVIGVLDDTKKSNIIVGTGYSWTKIFRQELIKKIRFREGVIYEDLDFLIELVRKAKIVANVEEVLYVYKNNVQSVSKAWKEQKKFEDMYAVMELIGNMKRPDGLNMAMKYVELNCYVTAIGICLLNQENKHFELIQNLKKLKAWNVDGWEKNPYAVHLMPAENKEMIGWFRGLKM